ncbi:MAG: flagellar FlbD family protein [Solirubrobacterales bacterium]|nr:flagellar FlbD family protein [Solirubrobacterales bacterium]
MITLHRLGHTPEPFALNPDLVATIDAAHDTHITLTTGVRIVVVESTEQVVEAIRDWRVLILKRALEGLPTVVRHL